VLLTGWPHVQLGPVLGEGGFATVRRAKHKITGARVAVKTIDLCKIQKDKLEMLENEIEVMRMLDHPNIVRLYETYSDRDQFKLHLVMELCEGGDLLDFLIKTEILENGTKSWSDPENGGDARVFSERQIAQLAAKMVGALQYLHSRDIAHRDIKPENFLLEARATDLEGSPFAGGEIKMIDFGFSKMFHGTEEMHQMMGSPYYVAPEILTSQPQAGSPLQVPQKGPTKEPGLEQKSPTEEPNLQDKSAAEECC
jgi:calcium-dependent protein kinase